MTIWHWVCRQRARLTEKKLVGLARLSLPILSDHALIARLNRTLPTSSSVFDLFRSDPRPLPRPIRSPRNSECCALPHDPDLPSFDFGLWDGHAAAMWFTKPSGAHAAPTDARPAICGPPPEGESWNDAARRIQRSPLTRIHPSPPNKLTSSGRGANFGVDIDPKSTRAFGRLMPMPQWRIKTTTSLSTDIPHHATADWDLAPNQPSG